VSIGAIFRLKYYLLMKVKLTVGSIVVDCEICIAYLKYCDDDDDNDDDNNNNDNNNRSPGRKPTFYKGKHGKFNSCQEVDRARNKC
jgi:hypothetical protein